MPIPQNRIGFDAQHAIFRNSVIGFFNRHLKPNLQRWEENHLVDREFWNLAGSAGLLCPTVPEEFGGAGVDFRYNSIVTEELAYAGSSVSLPLQSDIVADYFVRFGTESQKKAYLPGMISGDMVSAIAMTEPDTGSDLKAIRTSACSSGDKFLINGAKSYISNGQHCDFVIVAAKTSPESGAKGISLIVVDAGTKGFVKGRKLDKIGQHSADTSELFFDNVSVPRENLLGGVEGKGFAQIMELMAQERLSQAIMGQASAQRAFDEMVQYTKKRKAFGTSVFEFQNTRFVAGDLASKLQVGWAHLDWCINRFIAGNLTTAEASACKLWHTEMQWKLIDSCLQLHGGAGYMNEYPIARLWRDARVQRIYGGTSEILKEVLARSISKQE